MVFVERNVEEETRMVFVVLVEVAFKDPLIIEVMSLPKEALMGSRLRGRYNDEEVIIALSARLELAKVVAVGLGIRVDEW